MDSALAAVASDPLITEYAVGAATRFTRPVQNLLAPIVPVSTLAGRYKKHTKDARMVIPATRRSLGALAAQLGIQMEDAQYVCTINALDVRIDKALADDLKWLVLDALDFLADVESQALEQETIDLAVESAGDPSDIDFAAGNDPVELIDEQIHAVMKSAASDGVAVVFGPGAWLTFKNHPKVIARAGCNISYETTPALFTGNARFQTCHSLYDANPEGEVQSIDFLFPTNSIVVFARQEQVTRRDPSWLKTFRLRREVWGGIGLVAGIDGRTVIVKNDWATALERTNENGAALFNVITS